MICFILRQRSSVWIDDSCWCSKYLAHCLCSSFSCFRWCSSSFTFSLCERISSILPELSSLSSCWWYWCKKWRKDLFSLLSCSSSFWLALLLFCKDWILVKLRDLKPRFVWSDFSFSYFKCYSNSYNSVSFCCKTSLWAFGWDFKACSSSKSWQYLSAN